MDIDAFVELYQEVGVFFGILLIITLALWWLFTKHHIQKLLKESEAAIYVHKLQFEKEFEIYLELWEKIMSVMTSTVELRPFLEKYDPDETESETKQRRLKALSTALQELQQTVNNHKPFYAPDVYESAHELLHISNKEAHHYQVQSPNSDKYFDDAMKNTKEMDQILDDICESIRKRIFAKI